MAAGHGTAAEWQFGPVLAVTPSYGDGIFHHLESAGRRNIAASAGRVAVAWEDDHDGAPRIYVASKTVDGARFEPAVRISGAEEAFEPSIVALTNDRFAIAWEEGGAIHARIVAAGRLGAVTRIGDGMSVQANLLAHSDRIYLLRSQSEGRFSRIRLHVLRVEDSFSLASEQDCAIDRVPPVDDQFYPAAVVVDGTLVVAWEDRRPGHTIILASTARLEDVCAFQAPVRVSERRQRKESEYGKGHGVARVALSGFGESGLMAVWTDKRNYWEGYDIYAAPYLGNGRFGANIKVQDEFGDFARQWHVAIAGNPGGRLVVAWDDEREGNSDILLSWLEDGQWSEDLPLPGASGAGHQSHPSLALDVAGNLHAAWIERLERGGPSRLRYQFGRATEH
jgi:hypothetical protein